MYSILKKVPEVNVFMGIVKLPKSSHGLVSVCWFTSLPKIAKIWSFELLKHAKKKKKKIYGLYKNWSRKLRRKKGWRVEKRSIDRTWKALGWMIEGDFWTRGWERIKAWKRTKVRKWRLRGCAFIEPIFNYPPGSEPIVLVMMNRWSCGDSWNQDN